MSLGTLLAGMQDCDPVPAALESRSVAGISLDSRRVSGGDLFVALPGSAGDGRAHAGEALSAGALAVAFERADAPEECLRLRDEHLAFAVGDLREQLGVMAARYFGDPSLALEVIGITGTNGKTTCAWLLTQALERLGRRSVMLGTIGQGFTDSLSAASLTTGDAVATQQALRHWLDQGAQAACMEVSSHGLDQGRVNGVRFRVAVFTNLTRDHLDYHGDMATYAAAKKRLFDFPWLDAAVVNVDDPVGRDIAAANGAARTLTYGRSGADLVAENIRLAIDGIAFDWQLEGRRYAARSTLLGEVNLPNLLAVIGALLARGHAPERIAEVLPGLKAAPGRMELVPGPVGRPTVVVDYAHTPDSLDRALTSLRPLVRGRLITVFGCGGDRDRGKRAPMGAAAARHADEVVITNDNPRGEDPATIARMALEGATAERADIPRRVELDRARAIRAAVASAAEDDLVLIAGKGHETVQVIGDQTLPFSDVLVARAALEEVR